jgi:hypothetical protein
MKSASIPGWPPNRASRCLSRAAKHWGKVQMPPMHCAAGACTGLFTQRYSGTMISLIGERKTL